MKKLSYSSRAIFEARSFMKEKGISEEKLDEICGFSPGRVRAFLESKLLGNVKQTGENILSAIAVQRSEKSIVDISEGFAETSVFNRINDAIKLGASQRDIAVIYGDSGIGKTVAALQIEARSKNRAFLIEAAAGYTPLLVFSKINQKLGLCFNMPLYNLFDNAVKRLKDSGKICILDEAELVSVKTLDLLRRLHDWAGICVVLIGMPRLLENLRGRRGEHSQLYSRVGLAIKVDNIQESDAEKLVRASVPSAGDLWPEYWKLCNENARRLSKLCHMSLHISELNGIPVSRQVIRRAADVLLA
jgi:DNA transposition AAA+ family ATPase